MLGTESVEFYSTSFSNPKNGFKPLTPMSDQDRISPYVNQTSDENKEKYQFGDN